MILNRTELCLLLAEFISQTTANILLGGLRKQCVSTVPIRVGIDGCEGCGGVGWGID